MFVFVLFFENMFLCVCARWGVLSFFLFFFFSPLFSRFFVRVCVCTHNFYFVRNSTNYQGASPVAPMTSCPLPQRLTWALPLRASIVTYLGVSRDQ